MASYLERLAGELKHKGFNCPFLLMTSGGGLTTLETAAKFPIRLVESGPAGGAILARHIGGQLAFNRLLSFDMGGTTAKLCLIDDGRPLMSRSFEVDRAYRFKKGSGLPVRIPVIEMVEIGAGGGSIASIDKLQRVNVGPESAGSEPGPAAYDLGGDRPTVTDTDIQLGKIVTSKFAAGAIILNTAAAEKAINEHIGHPLNLDTDLAAFSVNEVVDENMSAAARTHAAEFGLDMGQRDVIAFGGAAPLHAGRLGQKLGVNRIVIPRGAGVGSAIGFLLAPVVYEVVRSRHQQLGRLDTKIVNGLFDSMHNEAISVVRQGSSHQDFVETRQAYMRYTGQGHEIAIDLPVADYTAAHSEIFQTEFEKVYSKLYGHVIKGVEIEVLSWTLTITAGDQSVSNPNTLQTTTENPEPIATQLLFDPDLEKKVSAPVFMRHQLPKDWQRTGPVLITEEQTTTVVSSAWQASIDQYANIVLEKVAAP
jgi:N-methylhydantoinase A